MDRRVRRSGGDRRRGRQGADVAQLLASTAALAGDERAVQAVVTALGRPAVAPALPFLQPAALSSSTRKLAGEHRRTFGARLDHLRTLAASAIGIEPPELVQVRRVTATGAAMAIGALVAVGALLLDVGDPTDVVDTLRNANWSWLALAVVVVVRGQHRVRDRVAGDGDGPPADGAHDRAAAGDVVLQPRGARHRRPGHAGAVPAEARRRPALGRGRGRRAERLRRARRRARLLRCRAPRRTRASTCR